MLKVFFAHQVSQEINTENAMIIRNNVGTYPSRYIEWADRIFSTSCMSLKQFVDPIMHLVFLGITKAKKI